MSAVANEASGVVKYLDTTHLNSNGQIDIPAEYRDALSLEAGASLAVLQIGDGLMLIPEQNLLTQLCNRIAQVFTRHGASADEILAGLPEARERVFARLYPELAAEESSQKSKHRKRK
ncbi:MAG: AbrB/MazE/SpoVT family DNA-binding domain-containing protein [Blastocatellia bacterium]